MTKYAINIFSDNGKQPIALFSDSATEDAMIAFAEAQFEMGNSLVTPGNNIEIKDLTTGQQIWSWRDVESNIQSEDCLPGQITLEDLYSSEDMFSCEG